MGYTPKAHTKTVRCPDCNCRMTVGARTRKPKRCVDCGIKRAMDAARQMQAKNGPAYDRWRSSMARAAEKQGWGSPTC
jgi:hypothetical protein